MINYNSLQFWEKTHKLIIEIYSVTRNFPREEIFSLTNQMRRAAVSIGSNIAEGSGKSSKLDFLRYLEVSLASANELDYQLLISRDLSYIKDDKYQLLSSQTKEVKKMIYAYIKKSRGTK